MAQKPVRPPAADPEERKARSIGLTYLVAVVADALGQMETTGLITFTGLTRAFINRFS